ncbi:MAG: ImmA/IrrE family metallo-endopeptidase [Phycisphaeraceae bacterium]|nr:ImmA/IrrE family metallo-endopeptidase [Phycisphaeraceae bacterium]
MARRLMMPVPRLRPARVRQIAELAEAVAEEHAPPSSFIDPMAIAAAHGITISHGDYGDAFDGLLECEAGRFHIYCNRVRCGERDEPRARFTMAHELGHYFIDEHRHAMQAGRAPAHPSMCDSLSPLLSEQEADLFAANLLMPRCRVMAARSRAARGLPGVMVLARQFGTSLTSAALRWTELDLSPCAVVKWSWSGYAWKTLSAAAFEARYRRTVECPKKLVDNSATRLALDHAPLPPQGYYQSGTTAATWFAGVRMEDDRNVILVEQAIPLGKFGVLTMLSVTDGR